METPNTFKDNRPLSRVVLAGMRDGFPIGLGYFAVGFSLGIMARSVGLTAFQGFMASLLNNASAGEYAGFSLIGAHASYLEMALMILVTNARYLLMSTALSQKFSPDTPFFHRFLIGFEVTDEVFGLAISRPGPVRPAYLYGAFIFTLSGWSLGTAAGILAGNVLPLRVVGALSVAIYGMFLAAIIPQGRRDRVVAVLIAVSFAASCLCSYLPFVRGLSEGSRTILLTLLLAGAAAFFFPVKDEETEAAP